MALSTCLSVAVVFVFVFDAVPVVGVRILLPRAVALDAHIGIRMAALAGLQVPPCLGAVIGIPVKDLCRPGRPVRFNAHIPLRKLGVGMAGGAEPRLMTPITAL